MPGARAAGAEWSRMRERGSIWGLRVTVACYRVLGPVLSKPLVLAVVGYFFLTDRAGRAASHQYLARVSRHTEATTPRVPTFRDSWLHYREFALSISDRVALWGGRQDAFQFDFHGREHFEKLAAQGRGAVLLGAHLGSFDALRVLSHLDRVTVNVLMYTAHAPKINEIFKELSPDIDVRVIEADPSGVGTALRVRACVERGEWVAILADRVEPSDRNRTLRVDFLEGSAVLPESPFLLPVVLGCPALMIVALRAGKRRYEVFAEPILEEGAPPRGAARTTRARELASTYARKLEGYCARAPLQWFNFYDFWAASGDGE